MSQVACLYSSVSILIVMENVSNEVNLCAMTSEIMQHTWDFVEVVLMIVTQVHYPSP